jgi:hypothetical protein
MKRILLLCLLPLCLNLQAQIQRGLKGSYNTEKFPEISFVWNSANSEVLQRSQFILTENDKDINFRLAVLQKNNILQKKKSILFLWEDMASHKGQLGFSRKLLTRFFDETGLNREDRFNIAVFNRVKDSGKNALQLLLPDFVDNGKELGNAVKNYQNSNEYFKEFPL